VTADGRVVQTDAEHHPDLFWAIRGGGGNFGVATRFQYRLHPVDKVTGGMLILPATPEAIASFIAAADAAPDEVSTIANVMPAPPLPFIAAEHYGEPVIVATIVYAGSPGEAKRAMEPFRGLAKPIADLIRELSYPEMYPQQDDEHRARIAARTMFVDTIDEDVAHVILDRLERSTAPMPVAQLRVLGGALARVPAEATAFAHRKSRIMINVAAAYANPAKPVSTSPGSRTSPTPCAKANLASTSTSWESRTKAAFAPRIRVRPGNVSPRSNAGTTPRTSSA
jgi:FAD/FMN-containing dehydrogenase